jgi:hypothetical protein
MRPYDLSSVVTAPNTSLLPNWHLKWCVTVLHFSWLISSPRRAVSAVRLKLADDPSKETNRHSDDEEVNDGEGASVPFDVLRD